MAFATLATIIFCLQLENKDLEKRKNCDLLNIFQNVSMLEKPKYYKCCLLKSVLRKKICYIFNNKNF